MKSIVLLAFSNALRAMFPIALFALLTMQQEPTVVSKLGLYFSMAAILAVIVDFGSVTGLPLTYAGGNDASQRKFFMFKASLFLIIGSIVYFVSLYIKDFQLLYVFLIIGCSPLIYHRALIMRGLGRYRNELLIHIFCDLIIIVCTVLLVLWFDLDTILPFLVAVRMAFSTFFLRFVGRLNYNSEIMDDDSSGQAVCRYYTPFFLQSLLSVCLVYIESFFVGVLSSASEQSLIHYVVRLYIVFGFINAVAINYFLPTYRRLLSVSRANGIAFIRKVSVYVIVANVLLTLFFGMTFGYAFNNLNLFSSFPSSGFLVLVFSVILFLKLNGALIGAILTAIGRQKERVLSQFGTILALVLVWLISIRLIGEFSIELFSMMMMLAPVLLIFSYLYFLMRSTRAI